MVGARKPRSGLERVLAPCTVLFLITFPVLAGDPGDGNTSSSSDPEQTGVNWSGVLLESLEFLGLEHGFRYATEEGTRHPHVSFFGGYLDSLRNLHGWGDGDPFYVNYVGHPMQGSVSGFVFVQNDRAFRSAEFGENSRYWKSRLRAAAYAWAYSEQFEIGPISEATIGNTQAFYPQQGFVDQVATPAIGLAWMIAEDLLDKYAIKQIEARTSNRYVWLLARGGLNPSRSLANVLAHRAPWHRDTRCDPWQKDCIPAQPALPQHRDFPQSATFEFFATSRTSAQLGADSHGYCIGGEGAAARRVATHWEVEAEVGGCKLTRFGEHLSGDSLTYLAGPRWTPRPEARWRPLHSYCLVAGSLPTNGSMWRKNLH